MQQTRSAGWKETFRAAFPHTVPVMAGYLFLGMTYGIFARTSGLSSAIPSLMSVLVYAGSAEFLMVSLLQEAFRPLHVFMVIFLLNARHLFYGISMLEQYRDTGWKRLYLIFGMSDETFSVIYTARSPRGIDKSRFMLLITLLDQFYWIIGATVGGIFGSLIRFNTAGLDFVMTAMFVVIFINQWQKEKRHHALLTGVGASVACLVLFGAEQFLLPAMVLILLILTAFRNVIEKEAAA